MSDQSSQKGSGHLGQQLRADAMAEAILESAGAKEPSLEQVREILFGAESRRADAARVALEGRIAERFGRLEAEHERRFEKLLSELQQRFEKATSMLESEAAERRASLQKQHEQLMAQIESSAQALKQSKTNRDELAGLLEDLASRLRAAGV
jgi:hypothetical protein